MKLPFTEGSLARLLLTDWEWSFFAPFLQSLNGRAGRKPRNHRRVLDGIFWIARTGAQWRDLPEEFGKWGSVYQQFNRWTKAGLWELILDVLNDSGDVPDQVQRIDSTITRAHHLAAGAKGGLKKRVLAARRWLYDQGSPDNNSLRFTYKD